MDQSPRALAGLYGDTELFRLPDVKGHDIQFAGENRNGLLFLCRSSASELPEAERVMLEKMLGALKMKLDETALIVADAVQPFSSLKKHILFKNIVVFGFSPEQLGLNINASYYRLIRFSDTQILFSEELAALSENKDKAKDRFWKAMKEMFT